MSREVLGESVSAVMDGEADELELRRVLAAAGEDPEVRARWGRYQLARSVLHKQTVMPGLDLAAAVSAAIAAEAAPAAAPVVQAKSPWQQIGRLAVAASVALAVLAGVRFYNSQDDAAGMAPQLAQQAQPVLPVVSAPQGPAVLASFPAPAAEEPAQQPAVDEAQILREVPRKVEAAPADQAGSR